MQIRESNAKVLGREEVIVVEEAKGIREASFMKCDSSSARIRVTSRKPSITRQEQEKEPPGQQIPAPRCVGETVRSCILTTNYRNTAEKENI